MNLNEYQEKALKTAIYGAGMKVEYPILGLCGETGEVANKYKKILRDKDGTISELDRTALMMELGDVLWYLAATCNDLQLSLEEVAEANLMKLHKRKEKGTIGGEGDCR